jgi:hypothetical protein
MRQTSEDDALIGLLSAIIVQAVDDYRHLQRRGCVGKDGEVYGHLFGRIKGSRSYHHVDGMTHHSDAAELVEFFTGWQLELLCDLTGNQACRIRSALGLSKK